MHADNYNLHLTFVKYESGELLEIIGCYCMCHGGHLALLRLHKSNLDAT